MKHTGHSEHCGCNHQHTSQSQGVLKRWVISFVFIAAALFFLRPFIIEQMLLRVSAYVSYSAFDDGVRMAKKIIGIDQKNIRAWNLLGYAYREKRELEPALDAYKKVLELDPADKTAAFDIAMVYYSKKDCVSAIPYFERIRTFGLPEKNKLSIGINDIYHSALLMLTECYVNAGDLIKAHLIESEMKKYYP